MKYLFLLCATAFSIQSNAQKTTNCNCDSLIETTYDKIADETRICGKANKFIGGMKEGVLVQACLRGKRTNKLSLGFVFQGSLICIQRGDKMNILFVDGVRTTVQTSVDYNCKGVYIISFGGLNGNKDLLDKLKSTPIEAIRLDTRLHRQDVIFNETEGEEVCRELRCLADRK